MDADVLQSQAAVLQLKPAAVLQQVAAMAAVLLLIQAAVLQQAAAILVVTAADVAVDTAASRCQSSVAQKFVCQSCTAQKFACLSATSVAAADAVHHAVHHADQLANQAAVLQLQLHVLALVTDIKSAKG